MSTSSLPEQAVSRDQRLVVFLLGLALGCVLGSLLTFWLGTKTLNAVQRRMRRHSGDDSHPNFDMLSQ